MKTLINFIIILFAFFKINAQTNQIKEKEIFLTKNIVIIDTIPIKDKNFKIFSKKNQINNKLYTLDSTKSTVYLDSIFINDTITIKYETINPNIKISLRDTNLYVPLIEKEPKFLEQIRKQENKSDLYTSGSFVRNFSNGNNQNLSINTDVDLRISGKLNDNLFVEGYISDNSLPMQYGESSSSLQELDKIYIKLYNSKISIQGGDINMESLDNSFLKFKRKSIGLEFNNTDSNSKIKTSIGISKNMFNRQSIEVKNGNQGPYKLMGENGELYILVVSDSESVFIDGLKKERGADKDYIINYNTGEITFTSENILNSNSRIIIEFQYTNQNYFKWIGYTGLSFKKENFKYYFNFFNESDNKNSPINPFSNEEIALLNNTGENKTYINNSYYSNNNSGLQQILYTKKDTIDLDNIFQENIFIFNTNNSDSLFQVNFINVGNGNGDYILESSLVNGSVFKWVSPVNGVSQGNYSPIKILIAPQKKQMFSFGGSYENKNTFLSLDIGLSNTDENLFSKINDKNNIGLGSKIFIKQKFKRTNLLIEPSLSYERLSHNFKFIERTRDVDFYRNWNLNNDISNQNLMNFSVQTIINDSIKFNYSFENIHNSEFNKIRNSINSNITRDSLFINLNGSLVNSINGDSLFFIKHNNSIKKNGKLGFQIINEGEKISDQNNNYGYNQFILNSSLSNFLIPLIKLEFKNRVDQSEIIEFSRQNSYSLSSKLLNKKNYKTNFEIAYSNFKSLINDSIINENSLISKADYFIKPNSFIKINGLYEISTGKESYREIRYVKVNSGYGTYSWIDYNNNDIQEYDEFEISYFTDTADYMKISFPTNNYFDIKNTRLFQQVTLNPDFKYDKGILYNLSFFENISSVEINKKIISNDWLNVISPFNLKNDENLISLNFNINNSIIYQPKNKNISATYKFEKQVFKNSYEWDKQLSISTNHNINTRLEIYNITTIANIYYEQKEASNENLISQNYYIHKIGADLELTKNIENFKPSFMMSVYEKENKLSIQKLTALKLSARASLNLNNGIFIRGNFMFYKAKYNDITNSQVSYQMLEGLNPGNGLKWEQSITKNIRKLEISFKYSGEINSDNKIHYGQIELKKYF